MTSVRTTTLFSIALLLLCAHAPFHGRAQDSKGTSSLYQITSGTYTMVGGIWGTWTTRLPSTEQSFVRLYNDAQMTRAELTFLNADRQTPFLTLSNGVVAGDVIRFRYLTEHPYLSVGELGTVDYTVTNLAGGLRLEGSTEFPPACCDIPWLFAHSNVTATALPAITIRVSELELSWDSESNRVYQVQYRSDATTNEWQDLCSPIAATGNTLSIIQKVPPGQPQRFYRVVMLPTLP